MSGSVLGLEGMVSAIFYSCLMTMSMISNILSESTVYQNVCIDQ